MLDLAQYQIAGSTAREIAATAEAAIREGSLGSGEPLPTVRALAAHLNTSPATVSAAYKTLARRGLVVAEGRRGTRVAPRPAVHASPPAAPMSRLRVPPGARDLAAGLPDPELLPAVGPVLARIGAASGLTMNRIEENDPELVELAARWFARDGIPAGPIAIVNGAFDGIERVLRAHLSPGDRVILEDPAYSAIRDLLLALGLAAVPLRVDERGPVPAELERALAQDPQAAVIVPRAQNPLG
jgi:DNA-binding transcriptional MocR family regulator